VEVFREMVDGDNNESGFALLYALGAIVLSTLMIGTIFLLARTVFSQIETIDRFSRVQDVQEFALQQATNTIKKKINSELNIMKTVSLGSDEKKIKQYVQDWFEDFSVQQSAIGSNKQFSYKVSLDPDKKFQAQVILPYVMQQASGEQGWRQATTYLPKVVNVELTFHLASEVEETVKGEVRTSQATSEYVYQVQWQEVDFQQTITKMDIWRYVFYSYLLPTNEQNISADAWLRKMDEVYHYQANPQPFNYEYDYQDDVNLGYSTDVKASRLLDFTTKPLAKNIHFHGSLFAENGLQINDSSSGRGHFEVDGLLVIKNQPGAGPLNGLNFIENFPFSAGVGTYVDLAGDDARLILINENSGYSTGNLLINNTNSGNQKRAAQQGFLLGNGSLNIKKDAFAVLFNYDSYFGAKSNPNDLLWTPFNGGHFVLASSNFYAGAVNENNDLRSAKDTSRQISVAGNFMITNAKLSSTTGVQGYAYFDESHGFSLPNQPSRLTLSGTNTSMTVNGSTFIDAPKTTRRESSTDLQQMGAPFNHYYMNSEYWNSITLKDGAQLNLAYTGVEPFVLQVEPSSRISMRLLPGLAFFDTTFLEEAYHYKRLKGQVLLKPANVTDQEQLIEKLSMLHIPYKLVNNEALVEDGVVSILVTNSGAIAESSQMIVRTFDFVRKVNN